MINDRGAGARRRRRRDKRLLILLIAGIVLLGVIIGVVLGLSRRSAPDPTAAENVTAPVVSKEILTYALAMLKRHSKERKDIWVDAMKMRIEQ